MSRLISRASRGVHSSFLKLSVIALVPDLMGAGAPCGEHEMKDPKDVLEDLREWLGGAGEVTPFFMKEIDIDCVRRAVEEIERLRRERASHSIRDALPPEGLNAANDK